MYTMYIYYIQAVHSGNISECSSAREEQATENILRPVFINRDACVYARYILD